MNDCIEASGGGGRTAGARCRAIGRMVVATLIAAGAASGAAASKCKLGSMELPVTMLGSRAIATVGINGVDVPMVVDSGAFFSFLTPAAAEQLQLRVSPLPRGLRVSGLTGSVDARMTTVKRLHLVRGDVPDVDFIVGGNEPGAGAMGLIGRNLLAFADTEYDLAHGAIRIMVPSGDCDDLGMAYWAGETPVSTLKLRRDGSSKTPAIAAMVKLNGIEVVAMFDTGARTLVALDAAHRAGIKDADMAPTGEIYGLGVGRSKAWTAPVHRVDLGGEAIENNRLVVTDIESDDFGMLLGIDFFLSHRIYVSKGQRKMYFTYNGGNIFALNTPPAAAPAASDAAAPGQVDQPVDASGYARRGAAFAARQDFVHALTDLDRACALAPLEAGYFSLRGQMHEALRHVAPALSDFDTALGLDPNQHEARMQRAWLRETTGDRAGALEDMKTLDKLLAPQAHMRLAIAQLYARLGMQDLALPQWSLWIAAHAKDEHLAEVLNSRCWARTMLDVDLDKALDDCDEAVDRQDKNAAFIDSRGWVHVRRGEWRKAISDYDRALKIRPGFASPLYGRGLARLHQGESDPGRADIAAAVKLDPGIDATMARYGLAVSASNVPVAATAPASSAAQ